MFRKSSQEARYASYSFLVSSVTRTPFWALFGMLPFILYKDLHASPWMITLFISLKPVVAIFSLYWGATIFERSDRLRMNILLAGILAYLPFLLTPWFSHPLFIVLASGLFMFFLRGATPGWMEMMKREIPPVLRERIFAIGSNFSWLGGGFLPLLIGYRLDAYPDTWRWDFFYAALFAVLGTAALIKLLPVYEEKIKKSARIRPWTEGWKLLASRKDFSLFQIGFFFGGAGLMLMQPALPLFFVDTLNLSYLELAIAFTLCKGIGYALSSPLWAARFSKLCLFRFTAAVTFLAALFPLFLIGANWNLSLLYIAYLIYGVMQAGSEMSWNLSGPIFAGDRDSSVYTSVNVVMVGLRGCFAPFFGSLLAYSAGPTAVLVLGGVCCLIGSGVLIAGKLDTRECIPHGASI